MIIKPDITTIPSPVLRQALSDLSEKSFKVLLYLLDYDQNCPSYESVRSYEAHEETKAQEIAEVCNLPVNDIVEACVELRTKRLLDGLLVTQYKDTIWIKWVMYTENPPEGVHSRGTALEGNLYYQNRVSSQSEKILISGINLGLDKTRTSELVTMPYAEYLQTPEWKEKARAAYARAGHTCQLCNEGNTELHAHHRTYERRGEEWLEDLIVLCANCHGLFHKHKSVV